jgi:hypothetical protein
MKLAKVDMLKTKPNGPWIPHPRAIRSQLFLTRSLVARRNKSDGTILNISTQPANHRQRAHTDQHAS